MLLKALKQKSTPTSFVYYSNIKMKPFLYIWHSIGMKNAISGYWFNISVSFTAVGIKYGVDWLLNNHVLLNKMKKQHPPHLFTIAIKNGHPY